MSAAESAAGRHQEAPVDESCAAVPRLPTGIPSPFCPSRSGSVWSPSPPRYCRACRSTRCRRRCGGWRSSRRNRRARLGGAADRRPARRDPLFRQRVGRGSSTTPGELGRGGRRAGRRPAAADPVEVAALAYLVRPPAGGDADRAGGRGDARRGRQRRGRRPVRGRGAAGPPGPSTSAPWPGSRRRSCATSWPGCARRPAQLREEVRALSRALRESAGPGAQGDRDARHRGGPGRPRGGRPRGGATAAAGQAGRRGDSAAGAARQAAKEARAVDDARLWLLLETIGQAAVGLRRELALDPADRLPADFVADTAADEPRRRRRRGPRRWTPTTRPGSTSCSRCPGRT